MQISAKFDPKTNQLSQDSIQAFRDQGFLRIPGLLSQDEVSTFREAVIDGTQSLNAHQTEEQGGAFQQHVNLWPACPEVAKLSLHPRICKFVTQLSGHAMRMWHDHSLIKRKGGIATEFHQDTPYWPFTNNRMAISFWVALVDVPIERGCMTFLPGTHKHRDLESQNLRDPRSFFEKLPEAEFMHSVNVPLKAGDCTVHNSYCAHRAFANQTDTDRVALITMFMDADAILTEQGHCVSDPTGLPAGGKMEHPLFPRINEHGELDATARQLVESGKALAEPIA